MSIDGSMLKTSSVFDIIADILSIDKWAILRRIDCENAIQQQNKNPLASAKGLLLS